MGRQSEKMYKIVYKVKVKYLKGGVLIARRLNV